MGEGRGRGVSWRGGRTSKKNKNIQSDQEVIGQMSDENLVERGPPQKLQNDTSLPELPEIAIPFWQCELSGFNSERVGLD